MTRLDIDPRFAAAHYQDGRDLRGAQQPSVHSVAGDLHPSSTVRTGVEVTKHTPGPWHLRTYRHPETDGRPWGWLDTMPSGSGRQSVPQGVSVTWTRGERSEANARLIAAAPDLLEVLREIIADGLHSDVVPHLHRKALAAIAKATGEAA